MSTAPARRPIIVAGPCAAETPEQIAYSIQEGKKRPKLDYLRVTLWKPRTKPGFDGLREAGIPLMIEAIENGLNPATEVLTGQQAQNVLDQVLPVLGNHKIMFWIGARNQNHEIQQDIARVCSQDDRVHLMVKNQPWCNEAHWEGIVDHCLSGGISERNLGLCHRGFMTDGHNPLNLRNVPDYEMCMRIKEKTGLPIIIDLSHTAGDASKVQTIAEQASEYDFDGILCEVHPNPAEAWTDAKQQITWKAFDRILETIVPTVVAA